MSHQTPSILFWVHTFPRFSETFIRDQVCRVLDQGCDVFIYGKSFVTNQKEALKGFEEYDLFKRFISRNAIRAAENNTNKYLSFLKKIFFLSRHKRFSIKKYVGYVLENKRFDVQSLCIAYFCVQNNITVIHAHFGPNGEEATALKRMGLQIKIVTTFHGYDVRLGLEDPTIYKNLQKWGDAIISISPYNKKILLEIGFDPDVIYDLPNGIYTDFYAPNPQKKTTATPLSLITVGRLVEEKAIHIAIKALKEVHDKMPHYDFRYTIIGDGELREPLEALIKETKLQDKITLLGAKNSVEVRDALQEASVFILSSVREAFPTVLMEAQATGLVVIATDVGSVSSIAVHGIIVPPNDSHAMADAIITTLEDKANWHTKGLQNRDYIVSHYNSYSLTEKLIALYNE